MNKLAIIGLMLGATAALPAAAYATTNHPAHPLHHHVAHHVAKSTAEVAVAAPAPIASNALAPPALAWPKIAPYPAGQDGDTDGLSENADDCNKGCVGVAP